MVCDSALAKDVEPRFEIHDHQGQHLQDKDDLLTQPRLAGGQQVWPNSPEFCDLGFYILNWLKFFRFGNNFLDIFLVLIFFFLNSLFQQNFQSGACDEGDSRVHYSTTAAY